MLNFCKKRFFFACFLWYPLWNRMSWFMGDWWWRKAEMDDMSGSIIILCCEEADYSTACRTSRRPSPGPQALFAERAAVHGGLRGAGRGGRGRGRCWPPRWLWSMRGWRPARRRAGLAPPAAGRQDDAGGQPLHHHHHHHHHHNPPSHSSLSFCLLFASPLWQYHCF